MSTVIISREIINYAVNEAKHALLKDIPPNRVSLVNLAEYVYSNMFNDNKANALEQLFPGIYIERTKSILLHITMPDYVQEVTRVQLSNSYPVSPLSFSTTNIIGVLNAKYELDDFGAFRHKPSTVPLLRISLDETYKNIGDTAVVNTVEGLIAEIQSAGAIKKKAEEAGSIMNEFLARHRTLQSAVKEFGPALLQFMPPYYVNKYNTKHTPRPRLPRKKEPFTGDISGLVAVGVAKELNLLN